MFREASYEVHSFQLDPGDTVMFYTDGVIEVAEPSSEEFGKVRLRQVCEQN